MNSKKVSLQKILTLRENKKSLSSSYESAPKQENECFKLDKKSIIWIIGSFVALSLFLFMHFIINIPTIIAAVIPGLIVGLVMRLYFKHFL